MAQLAILTALIFLLAFTPIGFLRVGFVEITFLMIPAAIGAISMGPLAGAILGGIFGLASFLQCFGLSQFGVALLAINPIYTFILCMIPRILMGWLSGLIFKGVRKADKTSYLSYAVASISAPIINTVLFMTFLIALFGKTDYIMSFRGDYNIIKFAVLFVGINGLVEALVCAVVGFAVAKALSRYMPEQKN